MLQKSYLPFTVSSAVFKLIDSPVLSTDQMYRRVPPLLSRDPKAFNCNRPHLEMEERPSIFAVGGKYTTVVGKIVVVGLALTVWLIEPGEVETSVRGNGGGLLVAV